MPSRSLAYNPDAPINAAQRSKNALARVVDVDPVRTFSPQELEDLRFDLLSPKDTLRRDRLIALIDTHDASQDFRDAVSSALDEADLETLADAVTEAGDSLASEIKSEWEDRLTEELADLSKPTPADLVSAFKVWHAAELKRIADDAVDTFKKLTDGVEATREALRVLNIT